MEFKAEQKYMLISPRKVRPVVAQIKKLTPARAVEILPFIKRRPSEVLRKVIKSAIANANAKGANIAELVFKEIQIGEGPRLKRGQPVSRGRWHPIKKRMSHIKVILTTEAKTENKVEVKKENKIEAKEIKAVAAKSPKAKAKPAVKKINRKVEEK